MMGIKVSRILERNQNAHVGSKAGWHPGWRDHKYRARKQTMMMLVALERAFDMLMDGMLEQCMILRGLI